MATDSIQEKKTTSISDTNVFGKPITVNEYADREARASAAYAQIDGDDKRKKVKDYVQNLKKSFGDGVSVLATIYNATGENLYFSTSKDWYGKLYTDGGSSYPKIIQNGQWAGFLHIKSPSVPSGSEAAVVYRVKAKEGDAGENADVVIAWDDSWAPGSNNKVYTEIAKTGSLSGWDDIGKKIGSMSAAESSFNMRLYSTVSIAQDSSANLEAVITATN
ncbi:unnamed protein product [Cuscuta europaea]|uniref:23 kDa jasmonate-induced protein-like n=1 Tax=Cuscuta europaea TaxID=41803 RepID=A0A9P0ZW67_CUSEU|nr:unnamed protein product [Cuscuta europaea]